MRYIILITIVLAAIGNWNLLRAQPVENKLVVGTIDSIHSGILNEKRKLWVHVPNGGTNNDFSKQKYPVVYLFDGNDHFNSVMSMVEYLSKHAICPQMIIVGISNTNRFRDLTPTKPSNTQMPFPFFVGGGKKFTSFLEKELIPYIDSTYPTEAYRMLIGHSLGGLMVINTLLHHGHLFNSYVSIDPSLWWDDNLMIKQADSLFQQKKINGKSLYLAMANNGIAEGSDLAVVMKDTSAEFGNAQPILLFSDLLRNKKPKGLQWKFQFYPGDSHGSVPFIAEYDALRFIFNKYSIPVSLMYQFPDPSFKADSIIIAHYKSASEQMG